MGLSFRKRFGVSHFGNRLLKLFMFDICSKCQIFTIYTKYFDKARLALPRDRHAEAVSILLSAKLLRLIDVLPFFTASLKKITYANLCAVNNYVQLNATDSMTKSDESNNPRMNNNRLAYDYTNTV